MSTVFRVEKTANYTVMSNTHLKDRRLSYKSKGLLSVILSLPPDWDYTITGLSVIAADGVDSVKTAVRELEQYGYVTRTQLRDERGRMAQNEYRVYENPADNPDYVQHEQDSPEMDAPDDNAAEHKPNKSVPKKKSKRVFSVSPSAENPSAVTPTEDNTQADTIV
ncbi:MAG: helix-turn-helix domain-containing protein, partial [Oscillospiraceae bacterium]|nr:helix-turn-helix domain-containing protein [Oscillospiraceae bacterium]